MHDGGSPTPRSRNAAFTRAAILEAACSRFAREGYEGASLRELASDAGVDPALICRYFGSKEDLFAEALVNCTPPNDLVRGGKDEFSERVARILILEPRSAKKLDHLLMVLRSVSSARAGEIVRQNTLRTFYEPLETWLGGDDAAVRARAVAGIIMGFGVSRTIDDAFILEEEGARERLCRRVAALIRAALD